MFSVLLHVQVPLHLSAVLLPHLPLLDALLQDPRSICALMCSDKELLQCLTAACVTQIPLLFTARDSEHELQLAEWLAGRVCCGAQLLAGHAELRLFKAVKDDELIWGQEENGTNVVRALIL
jgi:hypothetical protein